MSQKIPTTKATKFNLQFFGWATKRDRCEGLALMENRMKEDDYLPSKKPYDLLNYHGDTIGQLIVR